MTKHLSLIVALAFLAFSCPVHADTARPENSTFDLLAHEGVTSIAVATTGTVYTDSFVMPKQRTMALDFVFSSAAAVDVKVELEQGNSRPDTENSADADEWSVTDTISTGITDEVNHIIEVIPVAAKYGRLKFTGQGSNAASTAVDRLVLGATED